eukprot:EG_transcript_702
MPPNTQFRVSYQGITVADSNAIGSFLTLQAAAVGVSPDRLPANNFANLTLPVVNAFFVLDNTATYLTITFTNTLDTSIFPLNSSIPCSQALSPDLNTLVGTGALCQLTTPRQLLVTLGDNATLQPNMTVSLSPVVRPVDWRNVTSGLPYTGTVRLDPAMVPPVAQLAGPAAISECQTLVLDASASQVTTRTYRLLWQYLPADGVLTPPALLALLANQTNQYVISVPPAVLPGPGAHTFAVRIVDYFGQTANASFTTNRSSFPPPSVTLLNPAQSYTFARLTTVLTVSAEAVRCVTGGTVVDSDFSFQWTCLSQLLPLVSLTTTTTQLVVPPWFLSPGSDYVFLVAVQDPVTGLIAPVTAAVRVFRTPLIAQISGSSQLYIASTSRLSLDASGSSDPDDPTNVLAFTWAVCYEGQRDPTLTSLQGTCIPQVMQPGNGLVPTVLQSSLWQQPVLNLQASASTPFPSGWFKFQVMVSSDTRNATAFVFVQFSPRASEVLTVTVLRIGSGSDTLYHNADLRLVVQATVSAALPGVQYRWTAVDDTGAAVALQESVDVPTGPYSRALVLAPALLQPRAWLRLAVNVTAASGATASGQLQVPLNHPPYGGRLTVSAAVLSGQTSQTVVLRAVDWLDDSEGSLRYQFAYYSPAAGGARRLLTVAPQLAPTLQVEAPDFAAAHTITFEVDVFDVYNGQAAAFATATILPTSVTVETLATTAGSITTTGDVVAGLGEYFDRRRVYTNQTGQPAPLAALNYTDLVAQAAQAPTLTDDGRIALLEVVLQMAADARVFNNSDGAVLDLMSGVLSQLSGAVEQMLQALGLIYETWSTMQARRQDGPIKILPLKVGTPLRDAMVDRLFNITSQATRKVLLASGPVDGEAFHLNSTLVDGALSSAPQDRTVYLGVDKFAATLPVSWASAASIDGSPILWQEAVGFYVLACPTGANSTVVTSATVLPLHQDKAIEVSGLPNDDPLLLQFKQPVRKVPNEKMTCTFIDPRYGLVSTSGMTVVNSTVQNASTSVTCASSHMTMFLVGYSVVEPLPQPTVSVQSLMPWWGPFLVWAVYFLIFIYLELRRTPLPLPDLRWLLPAKETLAEKARRVLQYHDWLAFFIWEAYPILTRQVTVIYVTVMGAMLGNVVFLDSALNPFTQALCAALMLLPARGVVSLLFRYAPTRLRREAKASRAVSFPAHPQPAEGVPNPLGKPSQTAEKKNPLKRPDSHGTLTVKDTPEAVAAPQGPQSPQGPPAQPRPPDTADLSSGSFSDPDLDGLQTASSVGKAKKMRRTGSQRLRLGTLPPPARRPPSAGDDGDWEPEPEAEPSSIADSEADPWTAARNTLMQRIQVP